MSRYIDADDFRKNAYYEDTDIDIGVYVAEHGYADVVEVVRCRDCKYYESYRGKVGRCSKCIGLRRASDFCSYGERRANDEQAD